MNDPSCRETLLHVGKFDHLRYTASDEYKIMKECPANDISIHLVSQHICQAEYKQIPMSWIQLTLDLSLVSCVFSVVLSKHLVLRVVILNLKTNYCISHMV